MKLHQLPLASVSLAVLALFSQGAHARAFSCISSGAAAW